MSIPECSARTRNIALKRFSAENYDLLVIGGGITGTSVARDAALRGMKVALVEKGDFSSGTSSASSKLIHGGLRYLENFEFHLVFEALSERAWLMKTAKHLVHPQAFCLPVYKTHKYPRWILGLGLWFYDLLALFRAPGVHKYLNRKKTLEWIRGLSDKDLLGSFRFYDATMWDDALTIETARSAAEAGADIANYVEALKPLVENDGSIVGFELLDHIAQKPLSIRATRTVVCAGPWTDFFGKTAFPQQWKAWLKPSKGIHLVFDAKRFSVGGALVMEHPRDGRISFVIPRPDLGTGVTLVGTTDGPTPPNPENASVEDADIEYLFHLLDEYFPTHQLKRDDLVGTYVGVRPLAGTEQQPDSLQKVSREHQIGMGPGGVVVVAGGKYTTSRKIAEQVVDFAVKHEAGFRKFRRRIFNKSRDPINLRVLMKSRPSGVPEPLWKRYGEEAAEVLRLSASHPTAGTNPDAFPHLDGQVRFAVRHSMAVRADDIALRRIGLSISRKDKGDPWRSFIERTFQDEMAQLEPDS